MNDEMKAKLMGLALVLISVITTVVAKDATAACLLIPIGIWMIVYKEEPFDDWDEGEEL